MSIYGVAAVFLGHSGLSVGGSPQIFNHNGRKCFRYPHREWRPPLLARCGPLHRVGAASLPTVILAAGNR